MLGQKLQTAIKSAGITGADAAAYIGVSEANLYKLYKKSSFEVAYLLKAAELLKLPIAYFIGDDALPTNYQGGDFRQAGSGNTQKVKVNKGQTQGLAKANELDRCQRDNEALKRELALANALIAAKDEMLTLLRGSRDRPH